MPAGAQHYHKITQLEMEFFLTPHKSGKLWQWCLSPFFYHSDFLQDLADHCDQAYARRRMPEVY